MEGSVSFLHIPSMNIRRARVPWSAKKRRERPRRANEVLANFQFAMIPSPPRLRLSQGMDPRTTRAACIGFRDRYLRCRSSSTSICHFSIGPVDSFGRRVNGRSRLSSRPFWSDWESSATAGSRQCGNSVAGSRQPSADPMRWRPSPHAGARPGSKAATPLPWPFDSRPLGHRANSTDGWSARIAS
jgi:hypothetical protein